MATFTITTTQYIDELSGKSGADVYNINGGTLIVDQDSSFGLNQIFNAAADTTVLGAVTVSTTLGGSFVVDGTNVKLIPFNSGSGTITVGSTITMGAGSGKVIGIYASDFSGQPTTSGTSGWIKLQSCSLFIWNCKSRSFLKSFKRLFIKLSWP
jgi:hypothetical protein